MTLTIKDLKEMQHNDIIAKGTGLIREILDAPIKWVAVRGGMHDWVIYYGLINSSDIGVILFGNKVHTGSTIRKLVPCTDDAFDMYRF